MKLLIQKITIRDVEIALKKAIIGGMIIPDVVFEIIKQVEDSYEIIADKAMVEEAQRLVANDTN